MIRFSRLHSILGEHISGVSELPTCAHLSLMGVGLQSVRNSRYFSSVRQSFLAGAVNKAFAG